jgi:hypothetical protein
MTADLVIATEDATTTLPGGTTLRVGRDPADALLLLVRHAGDDHDVELAAVRGHDVGLPGGAWTMTCVPASPRAGTGWVELTRTG